MRFNAIGMNAVVVRYSVAPARFPTALLEVATAVKYVREEGRSTAMTLEKGFTIGFSGRPFSRKLRAISEPPVRCGG